MIIVSRRKLLKNNLLSGLKRFVTLNLSFFILLFLVRVYEFIYLSNTITLPSGSLKLEIIGFSHDVVMLLNIAAWFLLPFLSLHLISKLITNIVSGVLIIFFTISEIALIQYLGSTSLILGADLFGYSFDEVIKIASAGGGLSIGTMVLLIITVILMVALLVYSQKIKPHSRLVLMFVVLSLVSLSFRKYIKPAAGNYSSELAYNLVANKAYHIFSATYTLFYPDEPTEAELFSYFYTGLESKGKTFNYIGNEYPFLRKEDAHDVLGKYFNIGKEKPNLVFLIVESLGRAYSGEGAYLKSFTPFIDSLENKSLYWENVLSTAGRTFEVLPSVFGSMPYGRNGFAELGANMPEGMSLISLLKERGYISRFFYGGDATFDNMKLFLTKQHIDYVIEEKDFGPGYTKMPAINNFTWGYGEKDIFKKGFDVLSTAGSQPRLDIYLTLAMHDPYFVPDQEFYNKKAEEKLNTFGFDNARKSEYRKYLLNYASMLYFNDAIRYFFAEYQKRSDYKNTIFFITGDHRMSSPPISTQIDRFHVPLIIFSPMLKSSARFSSVVSHLDFTPSVVAFLKSNYGMSFPSVVPWLGQGLDSVTTFRNTMSIPFIRTKNEIIDYIDGEYFIVKDQLFKVSENMGLDVVNDPNKLIEIQRKFEKFKTDNNTACYGNKLIPDSLKFGAKK